MTQPRLEKLSDALTEAHTRIQQNHSDIDPVVGVSRSMRAKGFPADVITIDCLKSGKRIILILNDEQPDSISYQFSYKETDSDGEYQTMASDKVTTQTLYDWMSRYFSTAT